VILVKELYRPSGQGRFWETESKNSTVPSASSEFPKEFVGEAMDESFLLLTDEDLWVSAATYFIFVIEITSQIPALTFFSQQQLLPREPPLLLAKPRRTSRGSPDFDRRLQGSSFPDCTG
jgi:hypothetical protein